MLSGFCLLGPSDMACVQGGGCVITRAEVCDKLQIQLHTQRAMGDVFILKLWLSSWCEVAEACPECLCRLLGCELKGAENDSIFSKLAHGPEVCRSCHHPAKSNTAARKLCFELEADLPRGCCVWHWGQRATDGKKRRKMCKAWRGDKQRLPAPWAGHCCPIYTWQSSWDAEKQYLISLRKMEGTWGTTMATISTQLQKSKLLFITTSQPTSIKNKVKYFHPRLWCISIILALAR